MTDAAAEKPFKVCGACSRAWNTWEEFAADGELRLLGLQAVPDVPDASVLIFDHRCGSTVSVLTSRLHHLLPEHPAADWPSLRDGPECARHCFALTDHAPCERHCRNARDRDILKLVEGMRGPSVPVAENG